MLVNRYGFKAFNKYDLGEPLEAQLKRIKKDVETEIQSNAPDNGDAYVAAQVDKHKITPLELMENECSKPGFGTFGQTCNF